MPLRVSEAVLATVLPAAVMSRPAPSMVLQAASARTASSTPAVRTVRILCSLSEINVVSDSQD